MIAPLPFAHRQARIDDDHGLHLRPAARFAEVAQRFAAEIRVLCDGSEANGKSVLDLMCLAALDSRMLDLEARGPDAEEAVAVLADLISARSPEAEGCQVT